MRKPTFEGDLRHLDDLSGWRALFVLPSTAIDPQMLIASLPWFQNGAPRAGTLGRFFQLSGRIVFLTGGALDDAEGARLFELHERVKHTGARTLIVPAEHAGVSLVAQMFSAGVQPIKLSEPARNPDPYAAVAFVSFLTALILGYYTQSPIIVKALLFLAFVCQVGWFVYFMNWRAYMSDHHRVAATRWAALVPSRYARVQIPPP